MMRILVRVNCMSLILVAMMLWQYGGGRTYALTRNRQSQLPSRAGRLALLPKELAGNRFDALLAELKETVQRSGAKTKSAPEQGFADIFKITELKESLVEENEKIQEYFDQLEDSLRQKRLPGEILNRHVQSVREYEAKYETLMARLEGIEAAHNDSTSLWAKLTGRNKAVDWDGPIDKTLNFLDENTPRSVESHFDPRNLPHRSLKTDKPVRPKLTREDWLKAFPKDSVSSVSAPGSSSGTKAAASTPLLAQGAPTPADLAETIEVKFTEEIQSLANSLDRNPVKIFNWVRNNIEFVPTWGSIQGAQLCLENRAGNAFDTASLLIALLRASGIPARYQMGTIEVPRDKFMNWAGGFTNVDAAASLFASAGVPSVVRRVNESGHVISVKLEHTWVKAFVDYPPSGGAVNGRGDTWVEMDPSFKQHTFFQGIDFATAVPSDFRAFIDQLASTTTIDPATGSVTRIDRQVLASFLTQQADRGLSYVNTNFPNATAREIFGGRVIAARSLAVLAAAPPYRVLARATELSQIPDSLRHQVTIALGADPQMPDSVDQWSYTTSLPEIAGKDVLLLYVPASQADEQFLNSLLRASGGNLPLSIPSSVNLAAQLHVGGQLKATGRPLRAGHRVISHIKLLSPTVSLPAISNAMIVGEHAAIGFDLQGISPAQMATIKQGIQQFGAKIQQLAFQDITRHDVANLLLTSSIIGWFNIIDKANVFASRAAGVVTLRYPSVGMLFVKQNVRTVFGAAAAISSEALNMDIDGDVVVSIAKDGNASKTVQLSRSGGTLGSILEARVPESILSVPTDPVSGLSTMDALVLANDQGIPIFRIDASNASTITPILQVASTDLADIQDAINAGLQVTVSERPVSFKGQAILGIVIEDPRTGSAAFLISGGTNGAYLPLIFRSATLEYSIALPEEYDAINSLATNEPGFQWFPSQLTWTDHIVDTAVEALEILKDFEELGNISVPACFKTAYVLAYVGSRLQGMQDVQRCLICARVSDMGYADFATKVTCGITRSPF